MKLEELPSRRDYLYGPRRTTRNPAIKNFLTKDHIKLLKYEGESKIQDGTTNSDSYGEKTVKVADRVTAKLSTEMQWKSNFEFGTCSRGPLTTTTSSEFCKIILPSVKQTNNNCRYGTTSIPDLSPSCMKGKKIGDEGSVYASSYHLPNRKCLRSAAMKKSNLKSQTKDMQSTHFNLGTNKVRNSTESGHSYPSRKPFNTNSTPAVIATSCVFREGDWNITGSNAPTTSVSHSDFNGDKKPSLKPSLPRLINPAVPKPYNSSLLGSDRSLSSSLYQKDFLKYDMTERHLRPIQESRPKSSKIIVDTPDMVYPKSTEKSDFVYRHNEATSYLKKRIEEFVRNQTQDKTSCVVIATSDLDKTKSEKQLSLTSKDYERPSDEILRCHKLRRRPSPLYDYIRIDKGLIEQPEKVKRLGKEQCSPLPRRQRSPHDACAKRSKESYQTNFSFGLDNLNTLQSEQHGQFTVKTPLDPSYPAAGSNKPPPQPNTHIYAREDISRSDSIEQPSVMQADYNPILKRRMSCAQSRLVANDLKYPPKINASHYFHLDHANTEPKRSTTTSDYIEPELLLGDPGVRVQ